MTNSSRTLFVVLLILPAQLLAVWTQKILALEDIERVYLSSAKLTPLSHQIGGTGHTQGGGNTIYLEPETGFIIKPLPQDERRDREIDFYLNAERNGFSAYIPKFHGVAILDGNTKPEYIRLENLLSPLKVVDGVCDIKIGKVTYRSVATKEKKEREAKSYQYQAKIGWRFVGMKVKPENGELMVKEKKYGKNLEPEQLLGAWKLFFQGATESERKEFLSQILPQLVTMQSFLNEQREYTLVASSILIAYGVDENGTKKVVVKLIDFGNADRMTEEKPDENFLFGLRNLISKLEEL